ncbi:unnamed protein product [Mytilus coruscus]|uniref:RZ-type domain-containing protein n=1 Tax=Mytilus coruscus TaxID=42192 RepID=A0A6J8EFR6_MYTCO|nr:unnamed protein product [Mytilus coruscus]
MLLLSYTNHALDQFLLDISKRLQITDAADIVRLGGRSETEILSKYNLAAKRKAYSYKKEEFRTRKGAVRKRTIRESSSKLNVIASNAIKKLKTILSEHETLQKLRDEIQTGIVHQDWLHDVAGVLTDTHYSTLRNNYSLIRWLNIESLTQFVTTQQNHVAEIYEDDDFDYLDYEDNRYDDQSGDYDEEDIETTANVLNTHLDLQKLQMVVSSNIVFNLQRTHRQQWFWDQYNIKEKCVFIKKIKEKLFCTKEMLTVEAKSVSNIWYIPNAKRWRLYKYWVQQALIPINKEIQDCEEYYKTAQECYENNQQIADINILKRAKLVACTTTRAARDIEILKRVSPSIVLLQEAAEIPEHHVVACLTSSCQQLIMIGDHQQLRPSYNDYKTAREHNIDISLFERLIRGRFPYKRLEYQHRMRPLISKLLVPHIYRTLNDDQSVFEYENVKGTKCNMFFLSHSVFEDKDREELSRSHKNTFEAMFICKLYRYLRMQGYPSSKITVLSTYLDQGKNRTLRSRQFQTLTSRSELWNNIVSDAEKEKCFGTELQLTCQNHKNSTYVCKPDDFDRVADGGCQKPCSVKRQCGHFCLRKCHVDDSDHVDNCPKQCHREICELKHRCIKPCHFPVPCGKCNVIVEKTIPKCQHRKRMPCHEDPTSASCDERCQAIISCGHRCQKHCTDPCNTEDNCKELIKINARCGHEVQAPCYTKYDPPCKLSCQEILKCGHECKGTHSECSQGRLHVPCKAKCERNLVCGHICKEYCNYRCPPCTQKCDRRCIHGDRCKKRCSDSCIPCTELCKWACKAECPNKFKCEQLCMEPCKRPKCNTFCNTILDCGLGHKCSGLLCESSKCICKVCENLTEILFGYEDEDNAMFIRLEDCRCVLEVNGLDQYISNVMDHISDEIKPLKCPKCSTKISKSKRYSNELKIINKNICEVFRTIQNIEKGTDLHAKRYATRKLLTDNKDNISINKFIQLWKQIENTKRVDTLNMIVDQLTFNKEIRNIRKEVFTFKYRPQLKAWLDRLETWVFLKRSRYAEQEHTDFFLEIRRLQLTIDIHKFKTELSKKDEGLDIPENIKNYLLKIESTEVIDEDELSKMRKETQEISDKMIGLTLQEKLMIKRTMENEFTGSGHWYKCKNGHYYSIGECGMPMEMRKCPQCNVTIGESLLKQSDLTNSDPYYFSGKSLNDSDRTQLLFDIKMSSSKIVFPATDGRRYSSKWEEKFHWLRYSVQKDAAFCINCLAFCNYKDGDVFTDKGVVVYIFESPDKVHDDVVYFLSQWDFGTVDQNYRNISSHKDTRENRIIWFIQCLERLKELKVKTVGLPAHISCGLGRRDWTAYFQIIDNFAKENDIKFTLVRPSFSQKWI